MAAALARATMRRVEAVAAQAKRMTAEKAAVAKAHEDAKQDGLVEKTAGESGNAGWLRNARVKGVVFMLYMVDARSTRAARQLDSEATGELSHQD